MKKIKILKFEVGFRYFSATNKKCFYEVMERNGKEVTFKSYYQDPKGNATATVSIRADKDGNAHEVAQVTNHDGTHTVTAEYGLGHGRRLSTLPKERQEYIQEAIRQDVERRKSLAKNDNES